MIMRSILIFLCMLPLLLIGQEKAIVKEIEKAVSVDVNQDDSGQRDVKIISSSNGEEKVIQWKDNGTIPEDIKAQLKAEGIDLNILESTKEMIGEDVNIHIDRKEMTAPKKVIIKMIEDDGDTEIIEWNGEENMPEEMQIILQEHDIDIEKMGDDTHVKKARIKMIKKEGKEKYKTAMSDGQKKNRVQKQKYRTITINENGNEEVKEWNSDGNNISILKDGDHKEIRIGNSNDDENIFIVKRNRKKLPEVYMGTQLSSSAIEGALVEDIMDNGPASKSNLMKGDVIQKVNGARIKSPDDLFDLLSYYEPTDLIELTIRRDSKEEKVTLELGKRPKTVKF